MARKKKHAKRKNPRRKARRHHAAPVARAHKRNPSRKHRRAKRRNPGPAKSGGVAKIIAVGLGSALAGAVVSPFADKGLSYVIPSSAPVWATWAAKIAIAAGGVVLMKKHPVAAAAASAGFLGRDFSNMTATITNKALGGAVVDSRSKQMQAVYDERQMQAINMDPQMSAIQMNAIERQNQMYGMY